MTHKDHLDNGRPGKASRQFDFGAALAIGVSLGLIFGMLVGHLAIGLVLGLNLAVVANAIHQKRQNEPNANLALAISVGAVLLILVVWALAGMFG